MQQNKIVQNMAQHGMETASACLVGKLLVSIAKESSAVWGWYHHHVT